MSMDIIENSLDGRGLRIGIVQSRFNEYAGEGLLKACLAELARLGVVEEDITLMRVPGALEIPFGLQQLASTEEYDALIAIGACSLEEPHPKFLLATMMSPFCTLFTNSLSISSIQ